MYSLLFCDHDDSVVGSALPDHERERSIDRAMRSIENKPFGLIACDLDHPDAAALLGHAARIVPKTPRLVFGSPGQFIALGALHRAGLTRFVRKPVDAGELHFVLAHLDAPGPGRRAEFAVELAGQDRRISAVCCAFSSRSLTLRADCSALDWLRSGGAVAITGALPLSGHELVAEGVVSSVRVRPGIDDGEASLEVGLSLSTDSEVLSEHGALVERGIVALAGRLPPGWETLEDTYHVVLLDRVSASDVETTLQNTHVVVVLEPPPASLQEYFDAHGADELCPSVVLLNVGGMSWRPTAGKIAYEAQASLSAAEITHMIDGLLRGQQQRLASSALDVNNRALQLQNLLDAVRRIGMQSSQGAAATLTAEHFEKLAAADHCLCYLYRAADNELVATDQRRDYEESWLANRGLVSLAVRTAKPLRLESGAADERYAADIDNPLGEDDERLLLVPILGDDRLPLGVLVACRLPSRQPFSDQDQELAQAFAAQLTSTFERLSLETQVSGVLRQRRHYFRGQAGDLFRNEAMEENEFAQRYGDLVHVDLGWVSTAKWYLAALFVLAPLVLSIVQVHEVAEGRALIELEDADEVLATSEGMIEEVYVEPGDPVTAGARLLALDTRGEESDLARIEGEWDRLLRRRLEDPRDRSVEQRLTLLSAERAKARDQLEDRILRAPRAGIVRAIQQQQGLLVRKGAVVASIASEKSGVRVRALFPANYRPLIEAGMPLDLELSRFRNTVLRLEVESVADQIVGPNEAEALLAGGDGPTDASVLVYATLPGNAFEYRGRKISLFDGMMGTARVRLRSRPALVKLIPGLESAFGE